jgi:hypothetical protein
MRTGLVGGVWLVGAVLVALFLFMSVKAVCHECLTGASAKFVT